jgi:hypothetical protein
MVGTLVALFLLGPPRVQQPDTLTFRDPATAELFARAQVRHIRQDALVHDYRAIVRTRLEASAGRSRFARQTTLMAHESVAEIAWQRPNDLKVQVLGARAVAPVIRIIQGLGGDVEDDVERDLRRQMVMDRPWFIPRALGDSIRLMGVPEHAALHPLADGAWEFYRYAITDSLQIVVPNRTVRAYKMRVEPKRFGPALVAGDMWIDAETADVVRFAMVFLGDFLWETPDGETAADSAKAIEENETVRKFLSVEAMVEYALVDRTYWMPYRQLLAITAEVPWFVNLSIPAMAVTTFSEYSVNGNSPIEFAVPEADVAAEEDARLVRVRSADGIGLEPDTIARDRGVREERGYVRAGEWSGGRWEMEVPPADSLEAFAWDARLQTVEDPDEARAVRERFAELSRLEQELPPEWLGRQRINFALEQAADLVRFNRVQGLSFGGGVEFRPGPAFTSLLLTGRFGLADLRPTGAATWRRDGPVGRFDVFAYHDLQEVEPWTRGTGLGNSVNALFVAHDDADYYLGSGGGIAHTWNYGPLRNVEVRLGYEYQASVETATSSAIADLWGDGTFPPNPPIADGHVFRGSVRREDRIGVVGIDPGVEVLAGGAGAGVRVWAGARVPFTILGLGGAFQTKAALVRGDSLPQLALRLGGPSTVRGYDYGSRTGRELWAAQLDLALLRSRLISPVVFFDIGDTFAADPLIGTGVGLSLLNGLIRFNLAKGVHPEESLRFDLLFRAPR